MAVDTRDKLKDYVLRQLGAPYIEVEVYEETLDDIINDTIKDFSEFAYDGELEQVVLIDVDGRGSYGLPKEIQAIIKVSKGTSVSSFMGIAGGLVLQPDPLVWGAGINDYVSRVLTMSSSISMLNKFFGDEIAYDFNPNKKILNVFQPYTGPLLVHFSAQYIPDAIDMIYDHQWVKRMCVARALMVQATVTGKFDSTIVGGARINYADMRSRAEQEISELKQELLDKWSGPAPILIG